MTDFSPALLRFGDVSVRLSVELGRTDMPLRDVLSLGQGSVVALNRLTDELLDVTANGRVVAQGEVIAQDGKFALRIVQLVGEEHAAQSASFAGAPTGPATPLASAPPTASAPTPSAPTAPAPTSPPPDASSEAAVKEPDSPSGDDVDPESAVDELADALAEITAGSPDPDAETTSPGSGSDAGDAS
ncbi:MAG: flagellar motor switch protein FliN [Erythrobacter sp.]|uniref:flagellar motor switch protein FliN n=1 Tax=Erythrobacter sp. TaxID=1042 RepID=UPI00260AF002|nr:flagellar motor switch protein FliN [Erythrobacter sp.]MDJ0979133.1 flagellar motor switch protein FliN [Erythrobacter sp.]